MSVTYKNLYTLTVEEINKRMQYNTTSSYDRQLDTGVESIFADRDNAISAVQYVLSEALPSTIIDGLEVEATNPITDTVIINPGKGCAGGYLYTLTEQMTIKIPFDSNVSVLYIVLYKNSIIIQKDSNTTSLLLAKIVIPTPGTTRLVQDTKDTSPNAYIVNFKEYKLYGHKGKFEEDTIELLRDNMMPILTDLLIGSLKLSENLKIINTAGSMVLDSNSMQFFDVDGSELAYFGSMLARVGNISITPHTIQSGNYVFNETGFIMYDNGDCEFNNIRLRGTLYATTIEENIYITEGVTFIGDMNFDDDIALKAGKKLIFDRDLGRDTYWVYNNATAYLEGWVDGTKRVEL